MLTVVLINSNVAMLSLTFYTVICYSLNKEFEYLCRTFKYVLVICGIIREKGEKAIFFPVLSVILQRVHGHWLGCLFSLCLFSQNEDS